MNMLYRLELRNSGRPMRITDLHGICEQLDDTDLLTPGDIYESIQSKGRDIFEFNEVSAFWFTKRGWDKYGSKLNFDKKETEELSADSKFYTDDWDVVLRTREEPSLGEIVYQDQYQMCVLNWPGEKSIPAENIIEEGVQEILENN